MSRAVDAKTLRDVRLSGPPSFAKKRARRSAAQKAGLAYERAVGRELAADEIFKAAVHGQWIAFADKNGTGFAQPDFFLFHAGTLLVLECKIKLSAKAIALAARQLELLYVPLLTQLLRPQRVCTATLGAFLTSEASAALPACDVALADLGPEPLVLFWDRGILFRNGGN